MIRANQPHQNAAKDARAADAFVIEAWRALSKEAIAELLELGDSSAVKDWARRWAVDAPCMIEHGTSLLALHLTAAERNDLIEQSLSINSAKGTELPGEWLLELQGLDGLPLDGLREMRYVSPAEWTPAGRAGLDQSLANDDLALAPLSADPISETKEHFARRAEAHFNARRLRLGSLVSAQTINRCGPPKQSPELAKHVGWLVRFQVTGESISEIAESAGSHDYADARRTIDRGVRRLASLIGLQLRRTTQGRPRTAK